jgi:hypothetical protein
MQKGIGLYIAGAATMAGLLMMPPPMMAQDIADTTSTSLPMQPPMASVQDGTGTQTDSSASPSLRVQATSTVQQNSSASGTVTRTTTETKVTKGDSPPTLKPAAPAPESIKVVRYQREHVRSDWLTARRLAQYHWLDKAVEADPGLVEAICSHYTAALVLARHPRLGEIAQYDHYTCRRLTKWKTVARELAKNGECQKVVALDPEGIYRAIKRDRLLAKLLSTNPMFDQMIDDNPDLGVLISRYM